MVSEHLDRKEQILTKARSLFTRHGFKKCTIEDIASACGLTKAALYHYFNGKEHIFAEVVSLESGILMQHLRNAVSSKILPAEKLESFILTRFEKVKSLLNLYQISNDTASELIPAAQKSRDRFFDTESQMLVEILHDGIEQGVFREVPVKLISRTLISAFKGIESFFLVTEDSQTVAEAMQTLLEIFCYGLVIPKADSC